MSEPELPPEPEQPPRALPPPTEPNGPYPLMGVDPADGDAVRRALYGLVAGYGVDLMQHDDLDEDGRVQVTVYTNYEEILNRAVAYLSDPEVREA
jgi:hypothetical protein